MDNICVHHNSLLQNGHIQLGRILPCEYLKDMLPPRPDNQPLTIEFDIIIHDINSINAVNMDFRMDMFLHMTWRDVRLNISMVKRNEAKSDSITFPSYAMDYIWTPDPYITNSKQAEISSLTERFASLTIFTNSTLRYTARFFSVIGCQMEFQQYPRDIQNCSVTFESFKYSSNEIAFVWRKWHPVSINEDLKLLQFTLIEPLKHHVVNSVGPSNRVFGKLSQGLVVVLEFQREVSFHLSQTFLPSVLLVSLSWFSFWMGLDAIPGRVTLLVTSLLTLFTVFTGAQDQIPPVAYIKAIDVWMGGCMVFIFAAIGEFIIIKVLKEAQRKNKVNPSIFRKVRQPFIGSRITQKKDDGSRLLDVWDTEKGHRLPHTAEGDGRVIELYRDGLTMYQGQRKQKVKEQQQQQFYPQFAGEQETFALRWFDSKTGREKFLHEEIDKWSRIMFPLVFLLFMLIYFPILFTRSF